MSETASDIKKALGIASQFLVPYLVLRFLWVQLFPIEKVELSPEAREMEQQLLANPPEILLLGNSMIHRDIDIPLLARELDIEEEKIQKLWLGGAPLASVYVVLKERVFANGYRPKLIVVGTTPLWLMSNQIPEGDVREDFYAQLASVDSVLSRRLPAGIAQRSSWRTRKKELRDGFLETVRDRVSGQWFGLQPAEVTKRLDALFAFENRRKSDFQRAIPITELKEKAQKEGAEHSLDTSFAIPMAQLAQKYGSKIVFMELPMKEGAPQTKKHAIPKEMHRDLIGALRKEDAGHIHYTHASLPMHSFADSIHLNVRGRRYMTEKMAVDLKRMGALGGVWQSAYPPASLVDFYTLEGWIKGASGIVKDKVLPPGGTLDMTLKMDWHPSWGTLEASIVVAPQGKPRRPLTIALDCGQTASLVPVQKGMDNGLLHASVTGKGCKAGAKLTLRNPTDAPPLLLHSLRVGENTLLQNAERMVSLLTMDESISFATRELERRTVQPVAQDKMARIPLDDWSVFSSDQSIEKHGDFYCTPLQLWENQQILTKTVSTCKEVYSSKNQAAYCAHQNAIFFRSASGEPNDWGERLYEVALDPSRMCSHIRWFYAGDQLSFQSERIKRLRRGASQLRLIGSALSKGTWSISLWVGEEKMLQQSFSYLEIQDTTLQFTLWKAIPPSATDIRIELQGDGHLILSDLALGD
ncbi:MAG: hypothetical protein VX278_21390 [Myxococcota bacterium]|nr:hypothetical protein [Myxococcota bacterium]